MNYPRIVGLSGQCVNDKMFVSNETVDDNTDCRRILACRGRGACRAAYARAVSRQHEAREGGHGVARPHEPHVDVPRDGGA